MSQIKVPVVSISAPFALDFLGHTYTFPDLKSLLGAADISKAGDRNAGLSAKDETHREAARKILSKLTIQFLYDHPLTDMKGKIDSVMRVNYELDEAAFHKVASLTLGDFKNLLLKESGELISRLGLGLTGVMAAAVTKLCDTHELIYIARKITRTSKARTQIGIPKTLSSRLQPNHPTDDLKSIEFLIYTGLSMGSGDALIGMNPAIDTVENISQILWHMHRIREKTGAPTQICALSHVKTQMQCLKRGVPVEIIFQSLGGTEATNLEFDFSVETLDEAFQMMEASGPIRGASNFFYFETGQGSEFTYGKHNAIDMATLEGLCYGLARRYKPFMVNNVTGFIGPETHRDNFEMVYSCLQDHFMGKLLGIPMGMAPCYTLHSEITLEGQQMATQMLTAAGANYYMDVYLNTDRMLAYFDTSAHDNQTLREIYDKRPAPEYLSWAISRGIFKMEGDRVLRGESWGKAEQFCETELEFQNLVKSTAAVHGFSNAGPRPSDDVSRSLRLHQSIARDATLSELDLKKISIEYRLLETKAKDKSHHLGNPTLGGQIAESALKRYGPEKELIQIVLSDGLSAEAIHSNADDLVSVLQDGLKGHGLSYGRALIAPYGRVKLAEAVCKHFGPKLVILLIGERPGGDAFSSRSMSCYFLYHVSESAKSHAISFSGNPSIEFEYSVLSNIYAQGGIPPLEAGSLIVEKTQQILKFQAAGNRLESLLAGKR